MPKLATRNDKITAIMHCWMESSAICSLRVPYNENEARKILVEKLSLMKPDSLDRIYSALVELDDAPKKGELHIDLQNAEYFTPEHASLAKTITGSILYGWLIRYSEMAPDERADLDKRFEDTFRMRIPYFDEELLKNLGCNPDDFFKGFLEAHVYRKSYEELRELYTISRRYSTHFLQKKARPKSPTLSKRVNPSNIPERAEAEIDIYRTGEVPTKSDSNMLPMARRHVGSEKGWLIDWEDNRER